MANPVTFDRVLETTTTTGTGTLTLAGAVTGYQSFAVVGNGNTCPYTIWGVAANGNPSGSWETGIGTYTASGTTLARTTVLESSNSNAAVNFGSGTKRVALGHLAQTTPQLRAANTWTVGPQTIQTGDDGNKGLIVKANSPTQTADLAEFQDSSGVAVTTVNPDRTVRIGGTATSSGIASPSIGPGTGLVIQGDGSPVYPGITVAGPRDSGGSYVFQANSRGTLEVPTAIQSGDGLGLFVFWGFGDTDYQQGAALAAFADGNFSDTSAPMRIGLWTAKPGTVAAAEHLRVNALGQVCISDDWPNMGLQEVAAELQVDSTTRGLLPPRLTTTQRDAVSSPPEGLLVFNTTTHALNQYDGSSWGGYAVTNVANTFTVGPQTIETGGDANKGLIVKANSPTQTANVVEIQDSTGAIGLAVSGNRKVGFGCEPEVPSLTGANGRITISNAGTNLTSINLIAADGASNYPLISHFNSRGTLASPTTVQTNDVLAYWAFDSYNGAFFGQNAGIWVRVDATPTLNTGYSPVSIIFEAGGADGGDNGTLCIGNGVTAFGLDGSFDDTEPGLMGGEAGAALTVICRDASTACPLVVTGTLDVHRTSRGDAAAVFQIDSTTQGFLPPRLTTTQRDAVSTPPEGLLVFNTTTHALNQYNGSSWGALGTAYTADESTLHLSGTTFSIKNTAYVAAAASLALGLVAL